MQIEYLLDEVVVRLRFLLSSFSFSRSLDLFLVEDLRKKKNKAKIKFILWSRYQMGVYDFITWLSNLIILIIV